MGPVILTRMSVPAQQTVGHQLLTRSATAVTARITTVTVLPIAATTIAALMQLAAFSVLHLKNPATMTQTAARGSVAIQGKTIADSGKFEFRLEKCERAEPIIKALPFLHITINNPHFSKVSTVLIYGRSKYFIKSL